MVGGCGQCGGGGGLYQKKPFLIRGKLVATSAAQEPLVSHQKRDHNKGEQPRWPASLKEVMCCLGEQQLLQYP